MPHRRGHAFDVVITGQGIRTVLANKPDLTPQETDHHAISLAVQELVSGTGVPTRGIGLWITITGMRKPGRHLRRAARSGLLGQYGNGESEPRETVHCQGTIIRLTMAT